MPEKAGARAGHEGPFVDRVEAVAAFETALASVAPGEHRVLNFCGIGGIGKSRLQRELVHRLGESHVAGAYSRLDLQHPSLRQLETALYHLRRELGGHGLAFPRFDFAYAVHWQRSHPQLRLRADNLPLVQESELLGDLISAAGETPVVGVAVGLVKLLDKATKRVRRWNALRSDEELQRLDELDPIELLGALPFFFGKDLTDAVNGLEPRVVVLLDAYDALRLDKKMSMRPSDSGEWVKEFVRNTPGVLHVIGSREALTWNDADMYWAEPRLVHHRLEGLPDEDRLDLLRLSGIEGPDGAVEIARASRGIPFYIRVSIDQAARAGRSAPTAPVGHTQEELLGRFISHLDHAEHDLLQVLSLARFWNRDIFASAIREFSIPFSIVKWTKFCRYSFVNQIGGDRWTFHDLMREELARRVDPALTTDVHAFLSSYHRKRLSDGSEEERVPHFREAVFHAARGPTFDLDWFVDQSDRFMESGRWLAVASILEEMHDAPILSPEYVESAEVNAIRAYYRARFLRETGNLSEARQTFEALDTDVLTRHSDLVRFHQAHVLRELGATAAAGTIYESLAGSDVPSAHLRKKALTLLADYHLVQGRFATAAELLRPIVREDVTGTSTEILADAHRILGHVFRFNEDRSSSAWEYEEALRHFTRIDDLAGRAQTMTNLAEALALVEPMRSLETAEAAVEGNESIGARLEVGKALTAAAQANLILLRPNDARQKIESAITLLEEVGYASGLGRAILARAFCEAQAGDLSSALEDALKSARLLRSIETYPTFIIMALHLTELLDPRPAEPSELVSLAQEAANEIEPLDSSEELLRRLHEVTERLAGLR